MCLCVPLYQRLCTMANITLVSRGSVPKKKGPAGHVCPGWLQVPGFARGQLCDASRFCLVTANMHPCSILWLLWANSKHPPAACSQRLSAIRNQAAHRNLLNQHLFWHRQCPDLLLSTQPRIVIAALQCDTCFYSANPSPCLVGFGLVWKRPPPPRWCQTVNFCSIMTQNCR
jgi:hypothetical protein